MATVFLSQENAIYVCNTFETFMKDKYSFKYTDFVNKAEFYKLLSDTMKSVFISGKGKKDIGQMNFITISELKKYFIENHINVTLPPREEVQNNNIKLEPIIEEKTDEDFFDKLQKMELNRKIFKAVPEMSTTTSLPLPPVVESTASSYVAPSIATVYMPVPIKIGKEIKIYSWQRDWINEPNINYFSWKGPLPKFVDNTSTRIGCLICPKNILEDTNIISLVIEGANKDEVSVTLIPCYSVGEYTIFKPILESLSYLKLLALPWNISIESGDSEKINMGRDALKYTVSHIHDTYSTLDITCNYLEGDSIRIYNITSKTIIPSKVIKVRENQIDVIGKIKENGFLLNYNRQISVVFEIITCDHKN